MNNETFEKVRLMLKRFESDIRSIFKRRGEENKKNYENFLKAVKMEEGKKYVFNPNQTDFNEKEEYERTHSICCDAGLANEVCMGCGDGSESQWQWDKEHLN